MRLARLTICGTSPGSVDAARDLHDQAGALPKNEVQDHIWEDLHTEDLADLIIPKIESTKAAKSRAARTSL